MNAAEIPLELVGAWHWDIAQDKVLGTPGLYAIFGLEPGMGPRDASFWNEAILPEDRQAYERAIEDALGKNIPLNITYRIRRPDGQVRLLRDQGQVLLDDGRRAPVMFGSTQDVTDREADRIKRLMGEISEREALLRTIMDASPDFMLVKDPQGCWQMMNRAGEDLYRLHGTDWQGQSDLEVAQRAHDIYRQSLANCSTSDEQAWQAGQPTRGVEVVPLPEGGVRVFDVIKVPLFDGEGARRHLVVLGHDVTDRAEAEARLEHAAMHDALTGVANRSHFFERLNLSLARLGNGQRLAVIFLDLDHFKSLNDTYGHHVGDGVLQQVASRYRTALREGDLLARLGGDEFVVLLNHLTSCAEAEDVARRLIASLSQPVEIDGLSLYVTVSAGISLAPRNGSDAGTLMMYADSAMYRAKEMGRNTYVVYQGGMIDRASERLVLLGDLRRALDEDALHVHFQPQLNASTFEVESVEALARWDHPTLGAIPPERFIAMAEEGGLINRLGEQVMRETCRQLCDWRDRLGCVVRGAVNVSPVQLQHPDFVRQVVEALKSCGLSPRQLEIEITESALLRNPEHALSALRELRALGVSLALDDFGTGYSSLSYLKRFPFDRIKIDRSFVRDILTDSGDLAIVKATITMGHSLGLQVVAEGVEHMEQRTRLESLGCDMLQGHLLGRPAPASEIDGLFGQSFL